MKRHLCVSLGAIFALVNLSNIGCLEPADPESQDPELQDPELQDPELQDPELQDLEPADPESQDPESQDPEPQDQESQGSWENECTLEDLSNTCFTSIDGSFLRNPEEIIDSCGRSVMRGFKVVNSVAERYRKGTDGQGHWDIALLQFQIPKILRVQEPEASTIQDERCENITDIFVHALSNQDELRPFEEHHYSEMAIQVSATIKADSIEDFENGSETTNLEEIEGIFRIKSISKKAADNGAFLRNLSAKIRFFNCETPFMMRKSWIIIHSPPNSIEETFCREQEGEQVCAAYQIQPGSGCLFTIDAANYPTLDGGEIQVALGGEFRENEGWHELYITSIQLN